MYVYCKNDEDTQRASGIGYVLLVWASERKSIKPHTVAKKSSKLYHFIENKMILSLSFIIWYALYEGKNANAPFNTSHHHRTRISFTFHFDFTLRRTYAKSN